MTKNLRFTAFALLITLFVGIHAIAQTQRSQQDLSTPAGSNTYFVDQAGLQLAQTAAALGEFIDPETYLLGPYDVISIFGTGNTEFTYRAITVNATGDILLPVLGKISMKGLTLYEAQGILQKTVDKNFKGVISSVTLDTPRPINVYIGGDLAVPGKYTVPSGTRFDELVTGIRLGERLIRPISINDTDIVTPGTSSVTSTARINTREISRFEKSNLNLGSNSSYDRVSRIFDLRLIKVTNEHFSDRYIDLSAFFNSADRNFSPFIKDGDQISLLPVSSARPTVSISGAVVSPFNRFI